MERITVTCPTCSRCSVESDHAVEALLTQAVRGSNGLLLVEVVCGQCGTAIRTDLASSQRSVPTESDSGVVTEPGTFSTSSPPKRNGRPRRTDWQDSFLKTFALTGIVAHAARAARVDRKTVTTERERDAEFALRFDEAREEAADNLETFAHRYATTGLERKITETRRAVDGTVVVTERIESKVSPALLIFLLKAMRPHKYRENTRVEQTITDAATPAAAADTERVDRVVQELRAELDRLYTGHCR
jgi:hypothetical protein